MYKTIFSFLGNKKDIKKDEKLGKKLPLPEEQEPEIINLDDYLNVKWAFNISEKDKTEKIKDLIILYRTISTHPEIEPAIDEICDNAIVENENTEIIKIDVENENIKENLKEKIIDTFNDVIKKAKFNQNAYDYFRSWYIDGRLYFQLIIDENNLKKGILKVKRLNPTKLKRIKEDGKVWFLYEDGKNNIGYKIPEEHIIFIHSNLVDARNNIYISHLHKAIKPLNQLDLLENSAIIYRFTRAPERRVFYVDVGKMPPKKAEEYMRNLMNKFKSKIIYDPVTGEVETRKNVMSMIEDFWIPRMEGKSTEITTLPGGTQLGEIEDILYFRRKLLKALKVPLSRLDSDNSPTISFDRMGELTREELKFAKFINRLRKHFIKGFIEMWHRELLMKKIVDEQFWKSEIEPYIKYFWNEDSYFVEMKQQELLKSRLELLGELQDYIGKYFSQDYVWKNILKMTDEEIEQMKKQIEEEKKKGEIEGEEEEEY